MNEFPGYDPAHEQVMRRYSRSLPEDHRRRYAAVEAQKISYGGVAYVARVLGMSRATVHRGLRELEGLDDQSVYDHDFRHLADGVLVPHGVYDPMRNLAFMTLGISRETSAFVCDAIVLAWEALFRALYPHAREILLLFDCGGANAARSLRFKENLIAVSAKLGLPLRIAHYPPYTSKWNPIEHRLFSQIEKRWRGVILDTPQKALATLEQTRTKTGLRVVGQILDRSYEIGRACSDTFRETKDQFIRHDQVLGKWNYVVDANGFNAQVV